jgi:hypothetical protein
VSRDKINFVEKRKAEEAREARAGRKKSKSTVLYYPVAEGRNKEREPN